MLRPFIAPAYNRQVTFTQNELEGVRKQLPSSLSLDLSCHNSFLSKSGERLYVPFYVNTASLPSPKTDGKTFEFEMEAGSAAHEKGITKVAAACEGNIGEILFNSEKRLVPFFAVKDKQTGQVSGRILMRRNADAAGPKSLDWEALCRGATGEPAHISPESFERKIHQHLSAIDAKKDGQAHRVLVVGPGFGLSLAAMHKEHPDVDFVGLDVRDWAHALPVTNGIGASKSDVSYVTSHTVIADASPRKCSIPFKDGCFDAVVMHPAVFSLLGDPILTLSELFRVSKPDGKVVGDFGITPEHFDASKVRYFQKGLLSKKKVSLQDVLERHFGATVKTELVPTTIIPEAYNRFLEISGWKHTTPEYKKTTLNIDPEGTYDTGLAEREYVFPRKQRMKKE